MTHSSRAQINLRVSDTVVEDLDTLAEHEHLTRIDVARQILLDGIAERKSQLALRLYESGKVTKSRAAEIAGVTLWEWHDLLDQTHARDALSAAEVLTEVRRIVAEAAR
jgi:predicted HTH domain antitoxin